MIPPEGQPPERVEQVNELLESSELAQAIETEEFQVFLEYIPIAIIASRVKGDRQCIIYANKAAELLVKRQAADLVGKDWTVLNSFSLEDPPHTPLGQVLSEGEDVDGAFKRDDPALAVVEVYSGLIENEDAGRSYRIVALIDV